MARVHQRDLAQFRLFDRLLLHVRRCHSAGPRPSPNGTEEGYENRDGDEYGGNDDGCAEFLSVSRRKDNRARHCTSELEDGMHVGSRPT